ncbi:MAG: hypothetical protein MSC31_17005 [Solirubrobacteraceae bacterium MAG38_C4-C5]|nr:hypothetical protein [Candidatus Siliceabacter maunaloa]
MTLEITPTWASDQTVRLSLCHQRRELTVHTPDELCRYVLDDASPDRLGWAAHTLGGQRPGRRRVTVGEVVFACLREWEAEQAVLDLTARAAHQAAHRGEPWRRAAKRLRAQAEQARQRQRVPTLPFQMLWSQASDPSRSDQPLTASLAAERIGYFLDGRPDTTRLRRRLGVADQDDKAGGQRRQRAVSYDTALTLCTALGVDPVEVGL